MHTRQKTLLSLLEAAGRPVQRMELTKWCFLLRHESASAGGNAFYDFVPYRFGPFSFGLYHEAGKLEENGFLSTPDEDCWTIQQNVSMPSPPEDVEADIHRLLRRFRQTDLNSLLDYVYDTYPAYTVNSEKRKLASRPKAACAVFTAGYQGLSDDGFLNLFVEHGIERLIDVHCNPVARRFGFHRSTLARLLAHLDTEYVCVPQLGISSASRQDLHTYEDYGRLCARYETTTLATEEDAINRVAALVSERPSSLICMEADPAYCHRTRLASRVAQLTKLPTAHLVGTDA